MSSCSMSARLALAAAQASGWALAVWPWAKIGMSFEPSCSTSPHAVRDDRSRERHVGAGDALRQRHQIGVEAVLVAREPGAEAAEAGDHLVGNEEHVVALADGLDLLEVALCRGDTGGGAHHGLGDEGADGLRPLLDNHLFERCSHAPGEVPLALAGLAPPRSSGPSPCAGSPAAAARRASCISGKPERLVAMPVTP